MIKQLLYGLASFSLFLSAVSLPAYSQSYQVAQAPDWAVERIEQKILPYLDQKLSKGTFEFFKGVQNQELYHLRDLILSKRVKWDGDNRFEGYKAKLYSLREQYARRGLYLDQWWRWQNDGFTVSAADKKFVDGVDKRLRFLQNMKTAGSGYREETEGKIQEVEKVLARPEFSKNETLKAYKAFVLPQIEGAKFLNQEHRLLYVQREVIDIRNRLKSMTPGSKTQLNQIKQRAKKVLAVIQDLNKRGYKLTEHSILLDPSDPLSEEWNLQKTQAEMVAIGKRQK